MRPPGVDTPELVAHGEALLCATAHLLNADDRSVTRNDLVELRREGLNPVVVHLV
jgi:hypothetical protein